MFRFYVNNTKEATKILDENNISYDFDSGDRIMIEDDYANEATTAWNEAGIDYDEI